MMNRMFATFVLILSFIGLVGCTSFFEGKSNPATKTAIQFATLKVIDEDPERANRVIDIVGQVRDMVDANQEEPVSSLLDPIEQRVREEVNWTSLDTAEQVVVSNLIDTARADIEEKIDKGEVNPEDRIALKKVLDWIHQAAAMIGGAAEAQTRERLYWAEA